MKENTLTALLGNMFAPQEDATKSSYQSKALEAPRKIHEAQEFPCNLCDKKFNTEYRLKQHQVGKHGEGTVAFCGRKFQWPDTKYKHQRKCDTCKEVKERSENKPEYPKRIFRPHKKKVIKVLCVSRLQAMFCKYSIWY